jgi:hypothetical protein
MRPGFAAITKPPGPTAAPTWDETQARRWSSLDPVHEPAFQLHLVADLNAVKAR